VIRLSVVRLQRLGVKSPPPHRSIPTRTTSAAEYRTTTTSHRLPVCQHFAVGGRTTRALQQLASATASLVWLQKYVSEETYGRLHPSMQGIGPTVAACIVAEDAVVLTLMHCDTSSSSPSSRHHIRNRRASHRRHAVTLATEAGVAAATDAAPVAVAAAGCGSDDGCQPALSAGRGDETARGRRNPMYGLTVACPSGACL